MPKSSFGDYDSIGVKRHRVKQIIITLKKKDISHDSDDHSWLRTTYLTSRETESSISEKRAMKP